MLYKKKPRLKFKEAIQELEKVAKDLSNYTSYNSHNVIDATTGIEYPTGFACEYFTYEEIKERINLINPNQLQLIVNGFYVEKEEAFKILSQLIKVRFLSNLLSISYEMLVCSAFKKRAQWNDMRFSPYDFTLDNKQFDNKVIKLSSCSFDIAKIENNDPTELKRIAEFLLDNDINAQYMQQQVNNPKKINNRFIHLFVSRTNNSKNIITEEINLRKSLSKLQELAKEETLDQYTSNLHINGQEIEIIILVYIVD